MRKLRTAAAPPGQIAWLLPSFPPSCALRPVCAHCGPSTAFPCSTCVKDALCRLKQFLHTRDAPGILTADSNTSNTEQTRSHAPQNHTKHFQGHVFDAMVVGQVMLVFQVYVIFTCWQYAHHSLEVCEAAHTMREFTTHLLHDRGFVAVTVLTVLGLPTGQTRSPLNLNFRA